MNIVSLENVSKNYGFRPLFENVTLGLEDRDKIGIIGANGSGKTTLLRIIAGARSSRIRAASLVQRASRSRFSRKIRRTTKILRSLKQFLRRAAA